jgi:hypothetical protein
MAPAMGNGTWKSRFSPTAAPTNSATSVAIATASAWAHIAHVIGTGMVSRHTSGRLLPVTTPTLAARYWIGIATIEAPSTTHIRR